MIAPLLILAVIGWGMVWVLAGELRRSQQENDELNALAGYWRDEAISLGSMEID